MEKGCGKVRLHRTLDMGRRGPLPRKRIQIEDWVRREIVQGRLKPGAALPSREWFRARFTPNLNMVQRAFDELRREGFVETVPGHGSRVAASLPFPGRYLLLTRSDVRDAGTNYFAPALRAAAKALERLRGVVFDVRNVEDCANGRDAYGRMMEDVRRHRYAGVVAQAANAVRDLDCVTNIDDVPRPDVTSTTTYSRGTARSVPPRGRLQLSCSPRTGTRRVITTGGAPTRCVRGGCASRRTDSMRCTTAVGASSRSSRDLSPCS